MRFKILQTYDWENISIAAVTSRVSFILFARKHKETRNLNFNLQLKIVFSWLHAISSIARGIFLVATSTEKKMRWFCNVSLGDGFFRARRKKLQRSLSIFFQTRSILIFPDRLFDAVFSSTFNGYRDFFSFLVRVLRDTRRPFLRAQRTFDKGN